MYEASDKVQLLVKFSAFLCAFALAYSVSFIDRVIEATPVAQNSPAFLNAIFGVQIMIFSMICVFLALMFYAILQSSVSRQSDEIFLDGVIGQWIVISLTLVLALICSSVMVSYVFEGILFIDDIIEPVFKKPVTNYLRQIVSPFAISMYVLVLPIMSLIGMLSLGYALMPDLVTRKDHWTKKFNFHNYVAGIFVFIIGFVGSIFFSLNSAVVGLRLDGVDNLPISFQLIVSNAIFDGLTLITTAAIFFWASASWRARRYVDNIVDFSQGLQLTSNFLDADYMRDLTKRLSKFPDEEKKLRFLLEEMCAPYGVYRVAIFRGLERSLTDMARLFCGGSLPRLDLEMMDAVSAIRNGPVVRTEGGGPMARSWTINLCALAHSELMEVVSKNGGLTNRALGSG